MSGRQLVTLDSADLSDALAAPPGDALWMLAQQQALGELTGEDAGTPVRARVVLESIDVGEDAEAHIEATPLTGMARLRLAIELSRAVRAGSSSSAWAELLARFPLTLPGELDGDDLARATLWARDHVDGWAVLERGPAAARRLAQRWLRLHYAHEPGLWKTTALRFEGEHGDVEVVGHDGGTLRWTHLRQTDAQRAASTRRARAVQTVLPAPLTYRGMPARRWWTREDHRVDLAALSSGEHGDLPALVARFAVRAADDWFLVPVEAEVGRLWRVRSLSVEDAFGMRSTSTDLNDETRSLWQLEGDDEGWRYVPGPAATSGAPEGVVILHRDERTNSGWVDAHRIDTVWGGQTLPPPPPPEAVDRPTWRLTPPADPSLFAWVPRHDADTNRFVFRRTYEDQPIPGDLLQTLASTDIPEEALRVSPLRVELGWQRMVLSDGRDIAWRTWRTRPDDASSPGWLHDQVQER